MERLEGCAGEERVYMVDYSQGDVVFGDGRHGRIPPESPEESILVEHTRCDGHHGNIPQGAIPVSYTHLVMAGDLLDGSLHNVLKGLTVEFFQLEHALTSPVLL